MSQIDKLAKLKEISDRKQEDDSLVDMGELFCICVDAPVKPFFRKIKDENGNPVKDSKGWDKRSDKQDGWVHYFAEYRTANTVSVVLPTKYSFEPLSLVSVKGRGYQIRKSKQITIEKDGSVAPL